MIYSNKIAKAFKKNYQLECEMNNTETKKVIETLMIDVSDALFLRCEDRQRHLFLNICGHPQYQIINWSKTKT